MQRKIWFIGLLLSLALVACGADDVTVVKEPVDFDGAYLNQQIQLIVIPKWNSFKTTDDVAVKLFYDSENKIVMPRNYNLKLFIKQADKWLEIPEKPIERLPAGDVVLAPNAPAYANDMIGFEPILPDVTKTSVIRVYIFGDMTTPEGIKKVAAYAEITLFP